MNRTYNRNLKVWIFFSGMFNKGPLSCKVLAVAMYFFYMSSFFWMMIIAFDVCKTLKMATTQLRLTTGSQWRKFSLYSTVAWGLPVAFVTVVTILDHVEAMPEAFKPGNFLFLNNKKHYFDLGLIPDPKMADILGLKPHF